MISRNVARLIVLGITPGIGLRGPHAAAAQKSTVLETTVAPGHNYDRADFRLWYPPNSGSLQGVVVLMPGSNSDGRAAVEDSVWQDFATSHRLALIGCYLTDKPHDQSFIEEYADASRGSGQALLDALAAFAAQSRHPELASARLLLWGMSAGGEFNYEFTAWKPDRVIAFVVNKGGIYYSALVPRAARNVPAMLFVGEKDMEFRTNTIVGLFAVNRRASALWALAEEPNVEHVVGRSRDMTLVFFDEVLARRLGGVAQDGAGSGVLKEIEEKSGFRGHLKAKTVQAAGDTDLPGYPTAWLPSSRAARAWQALVTGRPFEP